MKFIQLKSIDLSVSFRVDEIYRTIKFQIKSIIIPERISIVSYVIPVICTPRIEYNQALSRSTRDSACRVGVEKVLNPQTSKRRASAKCFMRCRCFNRHLSTSWYIASDFYRHSHFPEVKLERYRSNRAKTHYLDEQHVIIENNKIIK